MHDKIYESKIHSTSTICIPEKISYTDFLIFF